MPPKSARTRKSMDSTGISKKGSKSSTSGASQTGKSIVQTRQEMEDRCRLRPSEGSDIEERVYDSIVFFIYCSKHDNVAVQTFQGGSVWLPFIVMPRSTPWRKATIDGVMMLIGRQDTEMDGAEAEKCTPEFRISCLHHFRVQVHNKYLFTRLTQFIPLVNNGVFECCKMNENVSWVSCDKIFRRQIPTVWGPELKILSSMLLLNRPSIIAEFTIQNAIYYYNLKDSQEESLLKSLKLTEQNVIDIYTDYLDHCYPSFYMCYQSYRIFMESIGYKEDKEERYKQLFNATAVFHKWYIDFHEFLIGLAVLEPEVPNISPLREIFLFNYYDEASRGYLGKKEMEMIVRDAHRNQITTKNVLAQLNKIARKVTSLNRVTPDEFAVLLRDPAYEAPWANICRSPKSMMKLIVEFVARKKSSNKLSSGSEHQLKASRPPNENGTCDACKPANYRYGNHSITIDTLGRCVESTIVSHMWQKPEACTQAPPPEDNKKKSRRRMDLKRYSLEITFSNSSIPNVFFDLVRNSFNRTDHPKIWSDSEESWPTFHKYLSMLCSGIKDIFHAEQKMLRLNSPCLIIGDIQGNLADLLFLEKAFFTSFPVIPEKLLFLGNYSGSHPSSFEVIVYLFSMKLMAPNKVFMLRGVNEMSIPCAKYLFYQCINKYGKENGKVIFSKFLDVFKTMPVAALVDENIFCAHSGIPTKLKIESIPALPRDLLHIQEKHPLVLELLTRHPAGCSFHSMHSLKSTSSRSSKASQEASRTSRIRSSMTGKSGKAMAFKSKESGNRVNSKELSKKVPKSTSGGKVNIKSKSLSKAFLVSKKKKFFKVSLKRAKRKLSSKINHSQAASETFTQAFEDDEFRQFLDRNDVTYFVRGNTPTPNGFWLKFNNRCISVYSCSTLDAQGAILFVDKSNSSVRIIRFANSCKNVHPTKLLEP